MSELAILRQRRAAISQIWALVNESRETGGEGDDAEAISQRAGERAVEFICGLPEDIPLPECAWEPDGFISLEWIHSRNRVFSLSIGEGRRLPYAWIDGTEHGHAVALFDRNVIPTEMLDSKDHEAGFS